MKTTRTHHRRAVWIAPVFSLLFLPPAVGRAEEAIDWGRDSGPPWNLDSEAASANTTRPNRIRLFRITPGFLADPVGLADSDDAQSDDPNALPVDAGADWLNVSMGPDNPFFDLRRPGDPGGVGYYKIHTQVQLFDSPNTGCTVSCQAVKPAGRDNDGLEDGPTVVSPAVSLFHALGDGTAIQGFVGKNVNLNGNWSGQLNQAVQYGMAVQRPLLPPDPSGSGNLFVFVEALGRYHYDATVGSGTGSAMEVLPGLQWQMSSNWWMSGGVVLPMNTAPTSVNQWQITCSFQF
jgi:hypothetical protein